MYVDPLIHVCDVTKAIEWNKYMQNYQTAPTTEFDKVWRHRLA